jgi:hypothetical protein
MLNKVDNVLQQIFVTGVSFFESKIKKKSNKKDVTHTATSTLASGGDDRRGSLGTAS